MAALIIGAVAWALIDPPLARRLTGGWWPADAAPKPMPSGAAGIRKCLRGSEVLYTQGACPPGSREAALTQGSITVVPPIKATPQAAAPEAGASRPNVRTLLRPPGEPDLRERQMDRVIGR